MTRVHRRREAPLAKIPIQTPAPARLRVSDPGDLLALVPYLLGFHPTESVVTVFIRSGRVLLTARVDLPPPGHADQLVAELQRVAGQHQVAEVLVIVYSADRSFGRAFLDQMVERLVDVPLSAALFVDGDRWFSTLCSASCCPDEGRPYEVQTHRLAAEAVYAGLAVRSDRAELQSLVTGPAPGAAERLARLAAAVEPDLECLTGQQAARLVGSTVDAVVLEGAQLDEAARLRLALLVTDLPLRDLAWASITRDNARAQLQLWADVVAVAPAPLASAPLCLLGLAAWVSGDGALQNCCAARIEREDPDYSLGGLLAEISARALPPTVWDELVADLRTELGLMPVGEDDH